MSCGGDPSLPFNRTATQTHTHTLSNKADALNITELLETSFLALFWLQIYTWGTYGHAIAKTQCWLVVHPGPLANLDKGAVSLQERFAKRGT